VAAPNERVPRVVDAREGTREGGRGARSVRRVAGKQARQARAAPP
jgi:hypothetical protein